MAGPSLLVLNCLFFLFFLSQFLFSTAAAAAATPPFPIAKPGCQDTCGNLSVPYPFGIGDSNCYRDPSFEVICNDTYYNPPKLFWESTIEILSISFEKAAKLRVLSFVGTDCYDSQGNPTNQSSVYLIIQPNYAFTISDTDNKFTTLGCDTNAYLSSGTGVNQFYSGCNMLSTSPDDLTNGSCTGVGCCQTSIPKGLKDYSVTVGSFNSHTSVYYLNPCSYVFIVEYTWYNFSTSDLYNFTNYVDESGDPRVPTVLDWAINWPTTNQTIQTCEEAIKDSSYACGSNTICGLSKNGLGYSCNCSRGYQGNPYIGCQDIDECWIPHISPCTYKSLCTNLPGTYSCSCPGIFQGDGKISGTGCTFPILQVILDINECQIPDKNPCTYSSSCINLPGTYNCSCPDNFRGDGRINGTECTPIPKQFPLLQVMLGTGLGFLLLLIVCLVVLWVLWKRKLSKLKEKFFKQNGGQLLKQQLSLYEGRATESAKIYTEEEIKKATNNYAESQIIGRGGYGVVYKGILANNQIVAIKKSKLVDESQVEQFINEVVILSQINHRNVVKLLGCCLETKVPLLVYEFVTNNTLYHHLHDEECKSSISWETRLKMANEIAEVLAYLHSAASTPIIHRDIKSANILLDDNLTAKVADFGASKLIPIDKTQLSTLVQGTLGYLDPEYFLSSQLTEKSDVYSFGVVLVELLTGKAALNFDRPEMERNLAMHFVTSMKENTAWEILEGRVSREGNKEQIYKIMELARRCLGVKGEERPTMKEVAMELEGLRRHDKHPWDLENPQEMENLLPVGSPNNTMSYDSLRGTMTMSLGIDGR